MTHAGSTAAEPDHPDPDDASQDDAGPDDADVGRLNRVTDRDRQRPKRSTAPQQHGERPARAGANQKEWARMGSLSPMHWIIVVGVVVLLFGATKLPQLARSLGQSARIFQAETRGMKADEQATDQSKGAQQSQITTGEQTGTATGSTSTTTGTTSTEQKQPGDAQK